MPPVLIDAAIVCATPLESAAVAGALMECRAASTRAASSITTTNLSIDFRPGGVLRGRLGELDAALLTTGFGPRKTRSALAEFFRRFAPRLLINFGSAGGVRPDLAPGALTVPRECVSYAWPGLEEDAPAIRVGVENLFPGGILLPGAVPTRAGSCPRTIQDAAAKAALWESLRIDTTDWETYALARDCAKRAIPFAALRVVTDLADENTLSCYAADAAGLLAAAAMRLPDLAGRMGAVFE